MTKTIIERFRETRRVMIGGMVALSVALALMLALPSMAHAAPANDNFADAETISGDSASINGDNVGATTEPGEPSPIPTPSTGSVWYSWTAPHSGYVAMDTCTSSFDTVLSVYKGSAVGSLTQVKGDDDSCTSPNNDRGSKLTFATEGTTYHIRVASFGTTPQGTFTLNLGYIAAPHDNFVSAEVISGDPVSVDGNNVGTTTETGEPLSATTFGNSNSSVWYRWQAPANGRVEIDTCTSDFNTVLSVYTGSAVGSLGEAASNDEGCASAGVGNPNGSKLSFSVTAGTIYRIRVASFESSAQGTFSLNLGYAPPLNDNFASAKGISGDPVSVNGRNIGATTETGEPDTRVSHSSVWYRWTAPETGKVEMDTCQSGFDTVLSVYTGSAVGSLTQRALDDQGCVGTGNPNTSKLSFNVTQGTNYFIRIASWVADPQQGNFTLKLRYLPPDNDNFADAATVSGESASTNGTNVGGSIESGETATGFNSVWYRWTAPANGQAELDTCTSDFNTLLDVYTGSTLGSLSQVGSDDNSCLGVGPNASGSKLTFDATKDTTYYIRVATAVFFSDKGNFTLDLVLTDNVAPDTTISDGPNGLTNDDTPTFSFGGSDNNTVADNLLYSYKVDEGAWSDPSSDTSVTLDSLSDGPHTFSVKALDQAGNEDPDPAEQSFTVEVRAPKVETVSPSENATGVARMTNITVTFSEPMKPNTLVTTPTDPANPNVGTSSTIKMKLGKKTVPLTVSLSSDGKTATLDPFPTDTLQALAANKKYKVTISTSVKDLHGKALDQDPALSGNQPKAWSFTTGST